ncbi:ketose-bisphosphate aldolase [Patescibacteria group bacterium]
MFENCRKIVTQAQKKGYAVGAFDCPNLEMLQAVIGAAEEANAPVIIMATANDAKYAGGLDQIASMTQIAAKKAHVPVGLHLDHGKDFDIVKEAIDAGYQSVMIDAAYLPFEENVALTSKVVNLAHKKGVYVQGELGSLLEGQLKTHPQQEIENLENYYTDPEKAVEFVKRTKVDSLAVAIGNLHGILKYRIQAPKLDFKRLETIRKNVTVPLVMHGSSKISDKNIQQIVKSGVSVFNYRTEFYFAFTERLRRELVSLPDAYDPRKYLPDATMAASKVVQKKIHLLGGKNKAK